MSIGRITVDLMARTGSFETDLKRAAKEAEKRAKEIDAAISKAGAAVGTALAAAGTAAIYFGKQLIDGLDALNDVKDATGASIENISALEDVALRTGGSLENVSSILVKFNSVLKDADGKNVASQALKALGLDAEELKRIDPAEALRQTAAALAAFSDDGEKARYVQELFGKSVKEAAPFLKDLAEQTELVGKVTAEQAQAAEDFNKTLFEMNKNVVDLSRSLLGPMVSSINEVVKAFKEGREAGRGFLDIGLSNYWKQVKEFWGVKDMNAPQVGGGRGFVNPSLPETRPILPTLPTASITKAPKAAAKERETELQRYVEALQKQIQKVKELSVEEKLLDDIRTGSLKLQKGETTDRALALAKQVDSLKAMAEYTKLAQEAEKERTDVLLKAATTQEEQVKTLTEGNKALREETEMIGKNAEAQAAIESARISSAIAIKEQALAEAENAGALARTTDAIREQIRLLTERKDLVVQKGVTEKLAEDSKKAEDFAKSVGAAFESSFEKAILEGGKLSDVLKGLAKDILALTLRQSITGPLASLIGGSLGGGGAASFANLIGGMGGDSLGAFIGIKGFANGGSPPVGKISMVGENGPELFVPNTAGTIIPNHALGGGGRGGDTYNFTVGDVATVSMVREAVATSQKQAAGALGRSQRYGGAFA
jgi:hypothetical protein